MNDMILTLDAGTTGIKGAVFREDGASAFSRVESYGTAYPRPGWAQQDPDEILAAAVRVIRAALEAVPADRIAALVFTGTMNGCIPVDAEGNALHPNIIHSDVRTGSQVDKIAAAIPLAEYYRITGNRIDVHSGLPKYLWLKENEPEVYRRAAAFVNIKDYLYGRATGRTGCTDRSDASLCNCMDMRTGSWAWDLLRTLGVDTEKMPRLLDSADVSGAVSAGFAAATGLRPGTPVAAGGGDGACAAHGARQHREGSAYMNIGSSAWVSAMSHAPAADPEARVFSYFDLDAGVYNVCGTVQSGSAASNWAIANLVLPGTSPAEWDFPALERRAESVPPGAEGVFFLPTLMGERTPWWTSKASGALIGFTQYHRTEHILRAVYEGVMQALSFCGAILREDGLPIDRLMLIGGGAKSRLWGRMAASMFGVPVQVHCTPHEATSLGAAFAAGVGIGMYRDYADAASRIRGGMIYEPDPAEAAAYEKAAAVWRQLYPNMKNAYGLVDAYQHPGDCSAKEEGSNNHGKTSL